MHNVAIVYCLISDQLFLRKILFRGFWGKIGPKWAQNEVFQVLTKFSSWILFQFSYEVIVEFFGGKIFLKFFDQKVPKMRFFKLDGTFLIFLYEVTAAWWVKIDSNNFLVFYWSFWTKRNPKWIFKFHSKSLRWVFFCFFCLKLQKHQNLKLG